MPTLAKPQHLRQMVQPDRDLPRLAAFLDRRRIAGMLAGKPQPIKTGEINQNLFPWYDKAKTHRKEASPALLLLRAAMERGWVRYGCRHGTWIDVRDRATIAEVVGMQTKEGHSNGAAVRSG